MNLEGKFVLPQSTLPTTKEILKQLSNRNNTGATLTESARETAQDVIKLWQKANLPTRENKHITKSILKLHESLRMIKRNHNRRTDAQIKREKEFLISLDQLFENFSLSSV